MQQIADRIKSKLHDKYPSVVSEIEKYVKTLQESKAEDVNIGMYFLLKTACEFNLLNETHDLLELNLFNDINQLLQLPQGNSNNGATLLGLAAFNGHIEIVSYLVEVRLANVNAKDANGDTPLHQVVYGDSHPFNHSSYGISHDRVAKYLIRNRSDLSIKNDKQQTPYDSTKWCAPLKIEDMIGRRFITNTGSAVYYADKVRPVLEKELDRQKRDQNIPVITIGGERQAKDFDKFCLEHAIEVYVKDKKAAFGYSSIEELYHALDSLSEEEWKHMSMVVSSQKPALFSWKMGLIFDQLPKMGKQSAAIGVAAALFTYYATQNILLSVATGSLSAVLALNYLTEAGYKQKINERTISEQRVSELQQHRFFKTQPVYNVQQLDEHQRVRGYSEQVKELSYNS